MSTIRPSVHPAKKVRAGDRFVLGTSSHIVAEVRELIAGFVSIEATPLNGEESERFFVVVPKDMQFKIYNR